MGAASDTGCQLAVKDPRPFAWSDLTISAAVCVRSPVFPTGDPGTTVVKRHVKRSKADVTMSPLQAHSVSVVGNQVSVQRHGGMLRK